MIDLSEQIGLPVWLNPDDLTLRLGDELLFGGGHPDEKPAARLIDDMRTVLRDHDAQVPNPLLYTMYRDVRRREDGDRWERASLRYDLTVIRPGALGSEYVKTQGHYHPTASDMRLAFPEVYQVVYGRAHYLLQHADNMLAPAEQQIIDDVVWVDAEPGDKVVMIPEYGHTTINPGDSVLVMANWVDRSFESLYQPILETHGGAYFELTDGTWEPNPRLRHLAGLRQARAQAVPQLGLFADKPLFVSADEDPRRFTWLSAPDGYANEFQEAIV